MFLEEENLASPQPSPCSVASPDRDHILIVDDDPDIVEAMKVVLSSKGYQVSRAEDSSVAQACLKEDVPDLIILDVMMRSPQEGFAFSRWLHQNETFKHPRM